MQHAQAPAGPALLTEAFSEFVSASARLEFSYRDLQAHVSELTLALSERNEELNASRSESRSIGLTLQRIVDAIPCGVLVVDEDGNVCLANPEAARLLALSAAQLPNAESIQYRFARDLTDLSGIPDDVEQELCFESSAGRHWIAVRSTRLPRRAFGADAEDGRVLLTLQDISIRKRAEREREAARDATALAQVSALLAHEIRNPLAGLELFAGLIADSPERRGEWISHLRAGIRSLSGTVNNVLALHSGSSLTLSALDVAVELSFAAEFCQPLAQRANVVLILDGDLPAVAIRANKSAFHQILLNLCSNALRHTPKHGTVRISAMLIPSGAVEVKVSDTGCGIAPHNLDRLFEGGYSGSGTTPGLGLAVCRRLVEQQGGNIRVESEPGLGSTFTLEFQPA